MDATVFYQLLLDPLIRVLCPAKDTQQMLIARTATDVAQHCQETLNVLFV
jgi:hypothetical protein